MKINYISLQMILIAIVVIVAIYFIVKNVSHTHNNSISFDKNKDAYVLFYAPQWCGWSKKIEPYWNEMIKDHINEDLNFNIYTVDCDEYRDTCRKFNIKGYPTIKYIKQNGDSFDYNIEYTEQLSENIYSFANNHN